jgi:hypothetical protein
MEELLFMEKTSETDSYEEGFRKVKKRAVING